MEIRLDGKPADITLENEKTVMELLAGIEQWLEGSGLVLSGLEIDGKSYGTLSLSSALRLPLEGLSLVNIKTSGWAELTLEALINLKNDLESFASASPEERNNYREGWESSYSALFLKENDRDVYTAALRALEEDPSLVSPDSVERANTLIAERIREIENPRREMKAMLPLAEEVAGRLEDLPLDMQTGKDSRAAETMAVFSPLVEKIFRLMALFRYFGADIDNMEARSVNGPEQASLKDTVQAFSAALKETLTAFENKDTVLVGDLAEYELAPGLRCIAAALGGMEEHST